MKVKLVDWETAKAIGKEKRLAGTDADYVYGIGRDKLPWGEEVESDSWKWPDDGYMIHGFCVLACLIEHGEPNG